MKIVVIGYSKIFVSVIESVLASRHELLAVFRHDRVKYSPFTLFFKDIFNPSFDLSFIKSKKIREIIATSANSNKFKEEIEKLSPDIIFVCSWSEKIKKEIFDIPKIGTINVHPSLLPKFRGPNPYAQVLFNNEKYSGVTFHFMNEFFDAGPILIQEKFEIIDSDDGSSIKNKAAALTKIMCQKILSNTHETILSPYYQDESQATYQPALTLKDAILDFNLPSHALIKKIKGLYPWAKAFVDCNGHFLEVKSYKISDNFSNLPPKSIINKQGRNFSIVTIDNKIISFYNTKLIKTFFTPSTRLFIKFVLGDKI